MNHELQHPIIQSSYINRYASLTEELSVLFDTKVLDIGSGLGFMKPLVQSKGGSYLGIEPDTQSFEAAGYLYGQNDYLSGYFPDVLDDQLFDVILILSCVDEVLDKLKFLTGVKNHLTPQTGVAYIAVRNGNFFINKFKNRNHIATRSERSQIAAQDLNDAQWMSLFRKTGLLPVEVGKFKRPWIIGLSFVGVKNIAYRLISIFLPRAYCYMLYYKIIVK